MASLYDYMKEDADFSILVDSLNSNMSEELDSQANLAWADSCVKKDASVSETDWTPMKDALMEILDSRPRGPRALDCSSYECSSRQPIDSRIVLLRENFANLGVSRCSMAHADLMEDGMQDAAEINEAFAFDDGDLALEVNNVRVRGRSKLDNVFRQNYTEDISIVDDLRSGLDLSLTTYDMEPSPEEIFGIWDLGISESDQLDQLTEEWGKAFVGIDPEIQSTCDDSTLWKDPMDVSVDDLAAAVGHLSLMQRT